MSTKILQIQKKRNIKSLYRLSDIRESVDLNANFSIRTKPKFLASYNTNTQNTYIQSNVACSSYVFYINTKCQCENVFPRFAKLSIKNYLLAIMCSNLK